MKFECSGSIIKRHEVICSISTSVIQSVNNSNNRLEVDYNGFVKMYVTIRIFSFLFSVYARACQVGNVDSNLGDLLSTEI